MFYYLETATVFVCLCSLDERPEEWIIKLLILKNCITVCCYLMTVILYHEFNFLKCLICLVFQNRFLIQWIDDDSVVGIEVLSGEVICSFLIVSWKDNSCCSGWICGELGSCSTQRLGIWELMLWLHPNRILSICKRL